MKKILLYITLSFTLIIQTKAQDIPTLLNQVTTAFNAINATNSTLTATNNQLSLANQSLTVQNSALLTANTSLTLQVKAKQKSIDSLVAIIKGITTPVIPSNGVNDYTQLNTIESNYFAHVIYAAGSLGYNHPTFTVKTTTAVNGEEIGLLKTMKGDWSVKYRGNGWSATENNVGGNGKIPSLIDDVYLEFSGNKPSTYYEQVGYAIPKPIAPPFEMWLVSRYMPGQRYEERLGGGGNSSLLGDSEYLIRAFNPQYGQVPNSYMPEIYKTHIERLVVKDQTQGDYWIDGKYIGTVKFQSPDLNNYVKTDEVIGANSNNALWDFAAQYYAIGLIGDADAATIFASLKQKWNTETLPNQILLSNINWTKDKIKYTPTFTVTNIPVGVTLADPSQWNYIWYTDDGSLQKQTIWSTKYQPLLTDWKSTMGTQIKVTIEPKDTNGKVWRYLEGTYSAH